MKDNVKTVLNATVTLALNVLTLWAMLWVFVFLFNGLVEQLFGPGRKISMLSGLLVVLLILISRVRILTVSTYLGDEEDGGNDILARTGLWN